MRSVLSIFCALALHTVCAGQDLIQLEKELAFHADVMVNASRAEHRIKAHETFHEQFSDLLELEDARTHPFEELEWLTRTMSPDSSFRIISWQIQLSEDQHKYHAFVVPLAPDERIIELHDKRSLRSEFGRHDPNTWYGALYYGIQPFATASGEVAYIVLGFNAGDRNTNLKVADVLTFTENSLQLGAPIFMPGDSSEDQEIRERIILEYADAASGRMQFDRARGLLVYDHVITIFTDGPDAGPLKVPDGSFHAYKYNAGRWDFINKVFNVKVDSPPGDGLDRDKNLDIFGRPKN